MLRLSFWWGCWWSLVLTTLLIAYRLHDPLYRGSLAIVAVWLLWLISRACSAALVGVCRADLRGARRWQHRLGSAGMVSLRTARLRYAMCFWLWWGVVIFGGIVTLPLVNIAHRTVMSMGLVGALALATFMRGHAAVDLYRAAASAAARCRVAAGD